MIEKLFFPVAIQQLINTEIFAKEIVFVYFCLSLSLERRKKGVLS